MLAVHLKEAEKAKQKLRPQLLQGERNVIRAAEKYSDILLTTINEDVSCAYVAQRQIELELRNVERLLVANANQNAQWMTLLDRLTRELKELGDVSNWLEHLEAAATEINEISKSLHVSPV
ncbi:unnamed protein product [Chondrus crispus]|uniref:Biogenesis of lysosome-related organelles complex 1 subunit 1 n=1 Tax=Chondrus crispus TaxID=2769 RepID=R7QBT4_CHOCR|nr:unnamed protein product [Chondrus crispus]CDF35253.1 unnamed protein product [Chondrus crispus]|eukprot:XP_005715072.1 unnamed protein product [Chondrus crispus]